MLHQDILRKYPRISFNICYVYEKLAISRSHVTSARRDLYFTVSGCLRNLSKHGTREKPSQGSSRKVAVKSRGVARGRKDTSHFTSVSRGFSIIMRDACGDMRNAYPRLTEIVFCARQEMERAVREG